jgi:hypothetical protein
MCSQSCLPEIFSSRRKITELKEKYGGLGPGISDCMLVGSISDDPEWGNWYHKLLLFSLIDSASRLLMR